MAKRLSLTEMKAKIESYGFKIRMLAAPNALNGHGGFELYINGLYDGRVFKTVHTVPCTISMDYRPHLDEFYKKLMEC